ncbi:MAG: aldehyde dehydrogenase family protein [Litorimonas sp.]
MTGSHLIAGTLGPGGVSYTRRDPLTGEAMAADLVSPDQADRIVSVAEDAREPLEAMDVGERADVLRLLAAALERAQDELVPLLVREIGCPVDQAPKLQVGSAVGVLRSMADLADRHRFVENRDGLRGGTVRIVKHPVGVCLGIVPWNVPLFLACVKLSAALAAGCPIILKPSPENAASMAVFAQLLADLPLPSGAVQCVTGDRDLGVALVDHPGVAKVSFTGSTAAGRKVAAACGQRLARCTLELGGKSAAILLEDADLDAVREQFFLATLQNNGQVCGAQSRVLVPEASARTLIDWIVGMVEELEVGDPFKAGTDIGPLATFAQAERVQGFLARAHESGVKIAARARADNAGAFAFPTVVLADPDDEIAREEVFGPVISVLTYKTMDEAVALSNDSDYGLSGSIWTSDLDRAAEIATRLRTGTVGINSKKILDFGAPFGGFRSSGLGRELGPEGIDAYLEASSILIPTITTTGAAGASVAPQNQPVRERHQ